MIIGRLLITRGALRVEGDRVRRGVARRWGVKLGVVCIFLGCVEDRKSSRFCRSFDLTKLCHCLFFWPNSIAIMKIIDKYNINFP